MADDDDDEEEFGGMFEDGHWDWDELVQGLVFISDLPPQQAEVIAIPLKAPTGTIEFRDNVDLLEQIRFRRRFQRILKPGQPDIITLQDVKDVALFTAPLTIMSVMLINLLHTPTVERFLRALILYCQYYLQTADVMATRMVELESKLRTPMCSVKENIYRDNLADLRVLVAKEYCTMLIGGSDVRKFHHMGAQKKRRSLTDMDARLIETLLRICVQIVWLALGRISFNQIELEIHRLFKSETFNMVEHNLKTRYIAKMAAPERLTLLGVCNKQEKKLKIRSPLLKEVFCHDADFRLTALGVLHIPERNPRLHYLEVAVAAPEDIIVEQGVSLGILGMTRSLFDTMLNKIKIPTKGDDKSRSSVMSSKSLTRTSTSTTSGTARKSSINVKIYPEVIIPPKDQTDFLPSRFPGDAPPQPPPPEFGVRACSETQRKRWLRRFIRLVYAHDTRAHTSSSRA